MKGISETEFVIFDVETTGLSPESGDRIVEIAALKVKDFKIIGHFETLINPQREISYGAFLVNRISPQMLKGAPTADAVLSDVFNFLENTYLVGHNVRFDLGFLHNEFALVNKPIPINQGVVDTVRMARKLLPGLGGYSLASVANALGVQDSQKHRAMADVEMTCQVFYQLLVIAKQKGIDDFKEINELCGFAQRIRK